MVDDLLISSFAMGSLGCAAIVAYPAVSGLWARTTGRFGQYHQAKADQASKVLDDLFMEVKPAWLKAAYGALPLGTGLLAFVFSNSALLALLAAGLGILAPDLCVKGAKARRRRQFRAQLVDALFVLSSSLRAGLSLTQAFERLEEEMPPPASQEFGLMLKAHRLGRTLEESLQGLNRRMPSEELHLITTAVLVARETGGDVTHIITQLITTIRERKKLNEKVTTLTLQGRLQAYIMSALPLVFAMFARTINPQYFQLLLDDPTGRMILAAAVGLWVIGMVLLMKLSRVAF